jgi:hypothetical protein
MASGRVPNKTKIRFDTRGSLLSRTETTSEGQRYIDLKCHEAVFRRKGRLS